MRSARASLASDRGRHERNGRRAGRWYRPPSRWPHPACIDELSARVRPNGPTDDQALRRCGPNADVPMKKSRISGEFLVLVSRQPRHRLAGTARPAPIWLFRPGPECRGGAMRLGKPTPGRLHFAPPQQSSSHMTAAGISLRIRPLPWQFAAKGSASSAKFPGAPCVLHHQNACRMPKSYPVELRGANPDIPAPVVRYVTPPVTAPMIAGLFCPFLIRIRAAVAYSAVRLERL